MNNDVHVCARLYYTVHMAGCENDEDVGDGQLMVPAASTQVEQGIRARGRSRLPTRDGVWQSVRQEA